MIKTIILFALLVILTACAQPTMTNTPSSLPPTNSPSTDSVEVWLTMADQTKRLSHEADIQFQNGANGGIVVNDDVRFQKMEGFGAAMTDSSAWLIMNKLDPAAREQLLKDLFTRTGDGIGLSYLRIPMGASDFALKDYTYDDMEAGQTDLTLRRFNIETDKARIIPTLKLAAALNPNLRLMGSPWSAPAWMKRGEDLHGGSMHIEYYQAFADYHVKFVQAYAAEGMTIDTVTPQNEPMFTSEGYPTMYMAPDAQQTFVRDFLGPAFKKAGLKTRILIFDHNWDLFEYPLKVLADPQAAAYVDGVAFHCYGGKVSSQSTVHEAHPDKGIWFTECSGGGWAPNFSDNISWFLQNLFIGNFRNWGNSTILWNLALDEMSGPTNGGCGNCRGVVTINSETGAVQRNEEYYSLGHVSKFVDPGAYRIDSADQSTDVPPNVAFVNPDGSLVLIVESDRDMDFTVSWKGRSFNYHLPARGVVTFKWNNSQRP